MSLAQDDGWYVFVSFTSKNAELARRVIDTLNSKGINCREYKEGIPLGTPGWLDWARSAIRRACAVIVIISPETLLSEPVHQELTLAYAFGKDILPLWVSGDGEDHRDYLWTDFRNYQAADVRDVHYDSGMTKVIKRIQELGQDCVQLRMDTEWATKLVADGDSLSDELGRLGAKLPNQSWVIRDGLLQHVSDREAVWEYLELCIIRRFEEIYRDNVAQRLALKAFGLVFMYGYPREWVAERLNLTIQQLEANQNEGLMFLRQDKLLVAPVRDWLSLKS